MPVLCCLIGYMLDYFMSITSRFLFTKRSLRICLIMAACLRSSCSTLESGAPSGTSLIDAHKKSSGENERRAATETL